MCWQQAWHWLLTRRKNAPHNADIWHLRHHARRLLPRIQQQVRHAIRDLNQYLQTEGFTCHPDKTQTGRLSRGFDWCGIDFTVPAQPRISDRSLMKHRERCRRLNEQLRARGEPEQDTAARVRAYRMRWELWADGLVLAAR
ncbi:hypothetical protein A6J71_00145 [Enterobacter cancerogenus]|nr:hypothetical protein A6J71_00145 [Enterobacter cancerogenus]